jgi:UDP-2-acetamido-3-amino-2,3-dideoxy-glucuronate N-acetyltransferase
VTDKKYFIHESSYVDDDVRVGEGTRIWHFCHILRSAKIGKNCNIGQNVCIESDVTVGDKCKIQNNVSIYRGVTLEDEVFCGPSCVFTNVYNPRAFIERKHEFRPTLVRSGATIGANATIVCGATIGRYALVGAGAVVKQDVPDYAIVAGVPAKQVGWVCKCGTTLKFGNGEKSGVSGEEIKDSREFEAESQQGGVSCGYCGNEYRLLAGQLKMIVERDDWPRQAL